MLAARQEQMSAICSPPEKPDSQPPKLTVGVGVGMGGDVGMGGGEQELGGQSTSLSRPQPAEACGKADASVSRFMPCIWPDGPHLALSLLPSQCYCHLRRRALTSHLLCLSAWTSCVSRRINTIMLNWINPQQINAYAQMHHPAN